MFLIQIKAMEEYDLAGKLGFMIVPEEVFCMAHVDHVVFPSHLLEVQGNELGLVAVDSL